MGSSSAIPKYFSGIKATEAMTKGIRDIKDIGMIARDDFLTCLSEQQKESYYSPIKKYPLDLSLKREEKEQRLN